VFYDEVVFDFTLPLFVIVYGTTGMAHLKLFMTKLTVALRNFANVPKKSQT